VTQLEIHRKQLSVDACPGAFSLRDVTALDSVRSLLSDDEVLNIRSQTNLGRELCSAGLDLASAGIGLLDLTFCDLSNLSAEALDEILAGRYFSIANEDDLLEGPRDAG
jgi:hypothetical protein